MKKNILVVLSALNMGGTQRNVSILVNEWAKVGHKVTLICTYEEEIAKHFLIHKDVKLIFFKKNIFTSKFKPLNLLRKLLKLRKIIKSQDPDVIVSFLSRINVAVALAAFRLRSSLIICERSWPPFVSLNKKILWFRKIIFKNVKKIVVQTTKSKKWLEKGLSQIEVIVIPNPTLYPIPISRQNIINPRSIVNESRRIILASGRMDKVKQFDLLIKAYSKIKNSHDNWDLVILGEGIERKSLDSLVESLKLKKRVFLPGKAGNISEWYERANLFVLSSQVEGFPNVLLEAMSYGIPSISFDCDTGPRDMIEQGVNGVLINPKEKDVGLSEAMDELIMNKEYRQKLSENSVLVREKYSLSNVMDKWNRALGL